MKYLAVICLSFVWFLATYGQPADNKKLAVFFNDFTEDSYKLFPLAATNNGNNRYNHLLPASFTENNVAIQRSFYKRFLDGITKFDRSA